MKIKKYIILSFILIFIILLILYVENIIDTLTAIGLLVISFAFHYIIYKHNMEMQKELRKFNNTIESILSGKLDARMISNDDNNRELSANINRLAKRLAKMTHKNEEDEQTIKILTNNITSPIIYIDIDGRIRYVNNHFINQMQVSIEINDIYEKIRSKNLYRFIDDAFILENKNVKSIEIENCTYQANAIPINNNQNQFVGILFIFHDITELKKYEKLQREFLADASHELKTPLSAIKGASEILLNGDNHSQETIYEFLTIIKNENERMERIVRDILLISRIESDNILVKSIKINVKQLLNEVIEIMRFKLESKSQTLNEEIESDLFIEGDYEKLKHAFMNLLINSINYTDKNKSIYINAKKVGKSIIISIRDEGIGIEKEEINYIFKRFYRVDKARSRDTGGTGLGLAIVKSTLDIHKAKIEVKSKVNEGTEFIITFKPYKK